ncbi:MAG: biotin--[acetyl-CoA-carboxylase] ligase, partial [Rikenellaceae bacterium]|nr:biotin--[acetyl-CoA-carboxylase] ligase [Rikenellaceae bacterium]
MIYRFDTLTSTNDEARNPRYVHGDIIVAEYQTEGRGQRGNRWASDAGKNLMFSVVLTPEGLAAAAQFSLLECVALALVDTFAHFRI